MEGNALLLTSLGAFLLVGLGADLLGKRTRIPRITLLLCMGILLGKQALDLVPHALSQHYELITEISLLMIGFLLGGKLQLSSLKQSSKPLLYISIVAALGATLLVTLGLTLFGLPWELALILGCIASATAPEAAVDINIEKQSNGPFSKLLLGIVALDDAWAMIIFSFGLAIIDTVHHQDVTSSLMVAFQEIGGGALLGFALGFPAAQLTGRIKKGQPMMTEALGLVLLCGGLALYFHVSFLIASMVLGATIVNLAKHHQYPFHEIENIELPCMIVFFLLAGALLDLNSLLAIGAIALLYILYRGLGKIVFAYIGGQMGNAQAPVKHWMGLALLPQAGAAMGMALLASDRYPDYTHIILPAVISTTVFFEIIGPLAAHYAIQRADNS